MQIHGGSKTFAFIPPMMSLERPADTHHVPGVGHEEVLCHMSWQQIEENSLIVQLHLLHVASLFLCLDTITGRRRRCELKY